MIPIIPAMLPIPGAMALYAIKRRTRSRQATSRFLCHKFPLPSPMPMR